MNSTIANNLFEYFQTLYEVNKKFIMLCGYNCHSMRQGSTKMLLDLIQDLFKLLPFQVDKTNGLLQIRKDDGLLEYTNEFDFIYDDYNNILIKYREPLKRLKIIRNKYEHKMHALKAIGSGDGTSTMFEFDFKTRYEGELINITICYKNLVGILMSLNVLFSKIQTVVSNYAHAENLDCPMYERFERVSFFEFNQIIESPILRTVGKIMFDF